MSFTIKVDPELCMGAQRCMFLAPSVFDLNPEGIAEVIDTSELTPQRAEQLASECPNMAIAVEHLHG